ncbi:helix-turn-helix domain-containing protein [Ferrimonas marina]|nr:helix-turn-helix domain-containing protein [Ferrimonas marina]
MDKISIIRAKLAKLSNEVAQIQVELAECILLVEELQQLSQEPDPKPAATPTESPTPLELLTPKEASAMLGVTPGTLSVWRSNDRYSLRYIKMGRRVMYEYRELRRFINERRHQHTSKRDND